jgi:penicillin-binding protein 1A
MTDAVTPPEEPTNISYKLKRDVDGFVGKWQIWWQRKRFRWVVYAAGAAFLFLLLFWAIFARNLPDAEALIEYESPLPTVVRDVNGEPFQSYARERRVQLEYADFPRLLIRAYLAAEDKTFFSHGGIDYPGIASAVFDNIFTSGRSRGASTITQQVAKNLLAIVRRNWVLGEMFANGWITEKQMAEARAMPLGLIAQRGTGYKNIGGYFTEEVRRQLIEKFGETDKDGPYSVYAGGLWVRTSMNPEFQVAATQALRDGLLRYNAGKAWKANMGTIDVSDDKWASRFASTNISIDYANWRAGVALGKGRVGFADGTVGLLNGGPAAMKAGDVIAVVPNGANSFSVRSVPEVGGGMVVQNPLNGRVLAIQGGFDNRISSFNRATQAQRQPGSTIKPFVYATALDNGMTPTSIIVDGPYCVWQGASLGQKCFRNFGGGGAGPQTMRWGLEQSRNLMTVRAAADSGMDNVTDTFRAMGIGDYPDYLSYALGAGDTTVLKMVNAYSMLVNQGRELKPTLIDFAQNRKGKVIFPENWKPCNRCRAKDWDGKPMPRFAASGKQVMDPITAYQTVHMLEGVIQRGTATILRDLDRPLFGKTGTTTGPTNV